MKFYICKTTQGEAFNCFMSLSEAKDLVKQAAPLGSVDMVDVPVTAEAIQRLLGNKGGYATEMRVAYQDK